MNRNCRGTKYDPNSAEGQFLLAHELAHVTQQNRGATVSMMPQEGADLEIDPDPKLEREADQAAEQALSADEPLIVSRMGTDVHLQRSAKGDSEYVTRGEVLEIVDNYYRGQVEQQAEMDATEVDPRQTPRERVGKPASETDDSGFFETMRQARTKTKAVGNDLSQAGLKGSVGSLASAGGSIVGKVGGASLGAVLGGAIGSLAGPIGTGAGAAAGYQFGETIGSELVGGAASDIAKQVTDYTLPSEHAASVAELHQKYESLREELDELKKTSSSTQSGDRPKSVPSANEVSP